MARKKLKINNSWFILMTGYAGGSPFCYDCKTSIVDIHPDMVDPMNALEWWWNSNKRSKMSVLCLACAESREMARKDFWKNFWGNGEMK